MKEIKNEEIVKEKINFYYSEKLKAHIIKHNHQWLNGIFLRKIEDADGWIVKEDKLGEVRVFVSEIFDIVDWREE
jgi:hypothetical protein